MGDTAKAHWALLTVNVLYGANYLIAKGLMPELIGPSGIIVFRVLGAGGMFFISFFAYRALMRSVPHPEILNPKTPWWPKRKDIPLFLFCGLTGVALNQLLFFNGLSLTSPLNSAIIMTGNPLMVLLLSAWLLRERVTWMRWAGVLTGAAGAVLLIKMSAAGNQSGTASTLGDLMILGNSLSYAFFMVTVKPLMKRYAPLHIISLVFWFGGIFSVPVGLAQAAAVDWSAFTGFNWFSLLYVVVGTTYLAYLLNIYALKQVSPSVASGYIYLQPLVAALFSWLLVSLYAQDYAADITWARAACGLLICAGVWMVSRGPTKA